MSAGPPHLDLEELLAGVNGDAVGDRVWMHLAACRECQAEAQRWGSAAAEVRHFVATAPLPPWRRGGALAGTEPATPAAVRHSRPRPWAGRKPHRVAIATAAATILAAGAISYGLTGRDGNDGAPGAAGLIAVAGCSGLVAGLGTAERVNEASLVLKTPGGRPVTVTTAASTAVRREVTGSVSDITDGARVFLRGIYAKGRIAAHTVSIGVAPKLPVLRLRRPRPARARLWIGVGTVQGAGGGGFILAVPGGTRLPVTTSGSTAIFTLARTRLNRLRAGDYLAAVGTAGPGGTLRAATVEEGTSLPHGRGNGITSLTGIGCGSATVATAALVYAS